MFSALSSQNRSLRRAHDLRRYSLRKNVITGKVEGIEIKMRGRKIKVRLISTMTVNGESLARASIINLEREISPLIKL